MWRWRGSPPARRLSRLLDEPLTGLDEEAVGDLAAALAAHRAQGGSVALSTHTPFALPGAQTLSLLDFQARA